VISGFEPCGPREFYLNPSRHKLEGEGPPEPIAIVPVCF